MILFQKKSKSKQSIIEFESFQKKKSSDRLTNVGNLFELLLPLS